MSNDDNAARSEPAVPAGTVRIFDTTLRDGEQAPGIALTKPEKVEIAEQLARLNVDILEAGFPISSDGEFDAVREIADTVKGPVIAALARTATGDIERAAEALKGADRWRIHTFISTSDVQRESMLKMSYDQVLTAIRENVSLAKSYTEDVEFSAQDATRTPLEFLLECFKLAVSCGATTINVPDTVGYATPTEFGELIRIVRDQTPDDVVISTHCHNDLGLAVANSLAGIENGAGQVEVAVNGIGERAGNCSLEEIAMVVRTRGQALQKTHGLNIKEIVRTSRLVAMTTGYSVQPNKAVVGASAFAHESGIHQHGVLSNRATYEIMDPVEIGLEGNSLVLGKHSGRHAFIDALAKIGVTLDDSQLNRAFARFKDLADRKIQLTDQDLQAIVTEEVGAGSEDNLVLEAVQVGGGTHIAPTATVKLRRGEEIFEESAMGDGMIDAVMGAIQRASGVEGRLVQFHVSSVTGGTDALGDVVVQIEVDGRRVSGRGVATDVVEASARAYLAAVNRALQVARSEGDQRGDPVTSAHHRIGVIRGDGTGPEVVAEGLKVLDAVKGDAAVDLVEFDLGAERYLRTGDVLPDDELEQLRVLDAVFLGAVGDPRVKPGILERDLLLKARFGLDQYVNLRPVVRYPGVETLVPSHSEDDVNFVVVRENSEGLYTGAGGFHRKGTPHEVAVQESINTRHGVERIVRYAFELAMRPDRRRKLTLVHKTNVLTFAGDLYQRVLDEVGTEFPEVETDYVHVDAACIYFLDWPARFDVIVTDNMFGDIITDLGAMIQGGMGIAAGGNINPEGVSMFEPIGGTAPDHTGKGTINPLAAIGAVEMLCRQLGEADAAARIDRGIRAATQQMKSMRAGEMGMSTGEVGDLVVEGAGS